MPFQKGQSGNPAGGPRGTVSRAAVLTQNLLSDHAESIATKIIELAEQGDMGALRVCMDRLVPAIKHQPVAVELPPIGKPADAVEAAASIVAAVAAAMFPPPRPRNWQRSSTFTCARSTAKGSTSA